MVNSGKRKAEKDVSTGKVASKQNSTGIVCLHNPTKFDLKKCKDLKDAESKLQDLDGDDAKNTTIVTFATESD